MTISPKFLGTTLAAFVAVAMLVTPVYATTDMNQQSGAGEMNFDQFLVPDDEENDSVNNGSGVQTTESTDGQSENIEELRAQVRELMRQLVLLLSRQLSQIPR